jgi:hypothetical protein
LHGELSDDVVPLTDEVQRGGAEGGLVELHRLTRFADPELRLDSRHGHD